MDFKKIDVGELGRCIISKILKATASHGNYEDILEECIYKGIKFNSRTEAASHFGVTVSAITLWIKKHPS